MPHGGYRRPEHPAAVSGPGALSARTDGGAGQPTRPIPDAAYGEQKEMEQIQGGAEMAATPPTPLGAPTGQPDVPVTDGADLGAGRSAFAAGIQGDAEVTNEKLRPLMYSLELMANLPGSNPETRQFVRALKARLSQRG